MNQDKSIPVLAIIGPTASGKSSLALKVAQQFDCEIVNCDSRQIYQGMNIGTAKPTQEEQQTVPHHLYDLILPSMDFSAGDYKLKAAETIRQIHSSSKIPLLTGGTGFYYSAISEGLPPTSGNEKIANGLQKKFKEFGIEGLQKALAEIDPEAYASIDLNNPRRLLRALEIVLTTGKPFSQNKPVSSLPEAEFFPIVVTRPRESLHERIEARVLKMLKDGLEKEVTDLFEKFSPNSPGLNSIGYAEWRGYLLRKKELSKVKDEIIINSRQYAKRQETWFKKRPGKELINLEAEKSMQNIFSQVEAFLKNFRL